MNPPYGFVMTNHLIPEPEAAPDLVPVPDDFTDDFTDDTDTESADGLFT